MSMRTTLIAGSALMILGLSACDKGDMSVGAPMAGGARATALLKTANGADAGTATASEVAGGLRFTVDVKGMPAGTCACPHHGALRRAGLHHGGAALEPDFDEARLDESAGSA
jgi:Cu-Zn family superoxide dismutase